MNRQKDRWTKKKADRETDMQTDEEENIHKETSPLVSE